MKKTINKLEQSLGFKIINYELYNNAITHKSSDKTNNYEKLEFLGDRVLGLCISKKLRFAKSLTNLYEIHRKMFIL